MLSAKTSAPSMKQHELSSRSDQSPEQLDEPEPSVTMAELSSDREIEKRADEDALLETVLHDSDHLLRDSLREEDRRRRARRRIVVSLFGGVLVMGTFLIAALAGRVTLFTPPPTTQTEVDRENWVKRIVGLRDHMQTAFGVGP